MGKILHHFIALGWTVKWTWCDFHFIIIGGHRLHTTEMWRGWLSKGDSLSSSRVAILCIECLEGQNFLISSPLIFRYRAVENVLYSAGGRTSVGLWRLGKGDRRKGHWQLEISRKSVRWSKNRNKSKGVPFPLLQITKWLVKCLYC